MTGHLRLSRAQRRALRRRQRPGQRRAADRRDLHRDRRRLPPHLRGRQPDRLPRGVDAGEATYQVEVHVRSAPESRTAPRSTTPRRYEHQHSRRQPGRQLRHRRHRRLHRGRPQPGQVAHRRIGGRGDEVTFDLAVHNAGPSDAAADVVVTDTLPVGMTYVSSTGTGWTCVAGTPDASGQVVARWAVVPPCSPGRTPRPRPHRPGRLRRRPGHARRRCAHEHRECDQSTTDPKAGQQHRHRPGTGHDQRRPVHHQDPRRGRGPGRGPLEFTLQIANAGRRPLVT